MAKKFNLCCKDHFREATLKRIDLVYFFKCLLEKRGAQVPSGILVVVSGLAGVGLKGGKVLFSCCLVELAIHTLLHITFGSPEEERGRSCVL